MAEAAKRTPGPWVIGRTGSDQVMILGGSSETYVCHVQIQQTGGGAISAIMEPERRANAQAIKALPDLLTALRPLALCDANSPPRGVAIADWSPAVHAARAALAKAEGRS